MTFQHHSTSTVLMIRPSRFGYNEQTASSNVFQRLPEGVTSADIHDAALREFDDFSRMLQDNGVHVVILDDTEEPHTPDAVFPNNWISTHSDGSIVLYPMEGAIRRHERRSDIVEYLTKEFGFRRVIDLTSFEDKGQHLEGTGSMVLDRKNSTVFACLSSRTHEDVVLEFAGLLSWRSTVCFEASTSRGGEPMQPIYHTNVMMALGETSVVICADAITDDHSRKTVLATLSAGGRRIVQISREQMHHFAGNMLQLRDSSGRPLWVMSSSAFRSLTPDQRLLLEADDNRLIHSPLDTIELVGGGSARCMLAEIFGPGEE